MSETEETSADETFDPSRRRLCPDGSCVGLLGDDGRCRVCGRTEAQAAAGEEAPEPAETGDGDGANASAAPGGFDPKRRLCGDGTCVGVVGDDGACRVCGRTSDRPE